jgi:hypothetical protein
MLHALLLTLLAGLAQDTPFEEFDSVDPSWTIVRRPDGCFIGWIEQGEQPSDFILFYNLDNPDNPLTLLLSSRSWTLRDETVRGYRLDFPGGTHAWTDLAATTYTSDGEGVIGIGFDRAAAPLLLGDFAAAGQMVVRFGDREITRFGLRNNRAALGRWMACLRSFPSRAIPRQSFEGG